MSWLSDRTGIHLGNVGAPIGAVLGSVIPGVGTAIGAGLGQAIGAVGQGKSVGQATAQGVGAGLGAKAIALAGDAFGGLSGIEDQIAKIPGGTAILNAVKSGAAHIGDLIGFVQQHAPDLLAAANVAEAAWRQGQADKYAKNAYQTATDAYDAKAPLRLAGTQGLLNPGGSAPALATLRSIAGSGSGNPFANGGSGGVSGGVSRPIPLAPNAAPSTPPAPGVALGQVPRPLPIARPPATGAIPRIGLPVASSSATGY